MLPATAEWQCFCPSPHWSLSFRAEVLLFVALRQEKQGINPDYSLLRTSIFAGKFRDVVQNTVRERIDWEVTHGSEGII